MELAKSKNKISPVGLELIHGSEACKLKKYRDTAGLWTIGWGHLIKPGESYNEISLALANSIFLRDLMGTERAVNNAVTVPLGQLQYDSLVSLAFNIGDGAFARSTLVRKLNRGDYHGAADEFLNWNKSGGKYTKGLANRRERERQIFLRSQTATEQVDVPETDVPVIPEPAIEAEQAANPDEPKTSVVSRLEAAATRVQASPLLPVVQASVNSEKRSWIIRCLAGIAVWAMANPTTATIIVAGIILLVGFGVFWLWGHSDAHRRSIAEKSNPGSIIK